MVADIVQLAFVIALDAREQVEIGSHVSAAKPILGEFDQEGVEAGARPVIVGLLVAHWLPAFGQQVLGQQVTANAVVPAKVIMRDRGKNAAHIRVKAVALGQFERVLALQGVRQV